MRVPPRILDSAAGLGTECTVSPYSRNPLQKQLPTVAIVAGSGMSYYGAACRGGADAVITGDVRYHDFHASHDRIPIIDPGHAESEVLVIDSTMEIIRNGADPDLARMIVPYAESTLPMEYLRPDGRD